MNDIFKDGYRKLGWCLKKGWLRLSLVSDPYFNFTEDMSNEELIELKCFIQSRKRSVSDCEHASDMLYILAAEIHNYLDAGANTCEGKVEEFYELSDRFLKNIEAIDEVDSAKIVNDREGDFSKVDAVVALKDLALLLPNKKYPWYVVSGTFLGLHREGGFLSHDYDIDIGIHYEGCDVFDICNIFEDDDSFIVKKVDYHIQIENKKNGHYEIERVPALIKLVHNTGINVDLFFHHRDGNVLWHGSVIHRWDNLVFDTESRVLEGVSVLAPVQADQYLTENYGDWGTPTKEFDCTNDTPNLKISKNFLSFALFFKKLWVLGLEDREEMNKLEKTLIDVGLMDNVDGVRSVLKII